MITSQFCEYGHNRLGRTVRSGCQNEIGHGTLHAISNACSYLRKRAIQHKVIAPNSLHACVSEDHTLVTPLTARCPDTVDVIFSEDHSQMSFAACIECPELDLLTRQP